ncbi:MAG TPA: aminotransferase class III-fold pyridoxal phosphate-dependent enzyme [Terriglobales bacterium]|nr:aminotransferase class III-fold pyridoxal phosphate-dependent enzyme [Terriglobales bacterium]
MDDTASRPTGRGAVVDQNGIEETYRARTPKSAELVSRANRSLPGGVTRGFGYYKPYQAVMERGEGAFLWDVDGHRYVDLVYNGLSLIHGHAYPPVARAIAEVLPLGWAWLSTNRPQIEFAEILCRRIQAFERVLFTNSGTESGMLAVKLARRFTGRPLILKATAGYHGTYSDLEAGLHGRGEIPGHTVLADFNDLPSFDRCLAKHGPEIAAVLLEPVMYTGVVTPPVGNFLRDVQEAAHRVGALFVLDDCLMLRLAPGGSAEKFGLQPDITFLGKFIGGGTPVGAVGARQEIMQLADPGRPNGVYHGGSFNGNILGSVAGRITLEDLTAARITKMDELAARLKDALEKRAAKLGLPLTVPSNGSVMGVYFSRDRLQPGPEVPNPELSQRFHLACLNNGVHMGPGGVIALSTAIDDGIMAGVISAVEDALDLVAK